jgi:hypothetical protein
MTPQEQELILSVARRLHEAPLTSKDAQAEELIQREIGAQKDAAYVLTQAVILQEHALKQAQERLGAMETELKQTRQQASAQSRGGFLGGLFGGSSAPPAAPTPGFQNRAPQPAQASGFGDFMRGAASVAVGVAGGQLLFSGLSGLFGADEATPSTEASPEPTDVAQSDYTHQDPGFQGAEEENAFDSFDTGDEEF